MSDGQAARWDQWASSYDEWCEGHVNGGEAGFLKRFLDQRSSVLEMAVGSGRVGLELAPHVGSLLGVDISSEMIRIFKENASRLGIDNVTALVADMSRLECLRPSSFDLVYVVQSGLFGILTQEGQLACLQGARRIVKPGGRLVIQQLWPFANRAYTESSWSVPRIGRNGMFGVSTSTANATTQRVTFIELDKGASGCVEMKEVHIRYCWPAELALMLEVAGWRVDERYADWTGSPSGPKAAQEVLVCAPRLGTE